MSEKIGLIMSFLTVNQDSKSVRGGICIQSEAEFTSEE